MTVDQRLHRAAHELRELPIELPTFAPPARARAGRRLLPTVVTSLLFVVGALAVVTQATAPTSETAIETSTDSGDSTGAAEQAPVAPARASTAALTPREELAIIARLGDPANAEAAAEPEDHPIPPGAS